MPLPEPHEGEKRPEFISRCMRVLSAEGGRPRKQQLAMCFSKWREAGGTAPRKKVRLTRYKS